HEAGLPTGAGWSVSLDGRLNSSGGPVVAFGEVNGSGYAYVVPRVPGYTASPSNGTFNVTGAPIDITVRFRLVASGSVPASPSLLGLPVPEAIGALGLVAALGAIGFLLLARRYPWLRPGRREPPSSGPPRDRPGGSDGTRPEFYPGSDGPPAGSADRETAGPTGR
ncbi:MAG TPA: hypothetical protein VGV64_08380, partial [Thermoplasmata archaeon]|nr:hypothetical protein [Thermoplasmata archaeon]